MNKESKDLLKSVIPATIVALGICIILGMIMSKDTDYHPKSHWNLELAKSATNVKIIPRFDLNKYNLTVNREIIFTHTDEIIDWANAIEEARRGNNPSPHRSRGPKAFYVEFNYSNKSYVKFDVWICSNWPLASCKEEYQGEASIHSGIDTYYGKDLRKIIDTSIETLPGIWRKSSRY